MVWQSSPYILLLFVAAVVSFLWTLYGISNVRTHGRRPHVVAFVVLSFASAIWAAVYAIQLASTTLETALLAYKTLHVGAAMAPPAWFAFALAYSGRSDWLTPVTIAGIVAIPVALLVALPTNPSSLALTAATMEPRGSLTVLVTGNGPLYQLHLAYSYVIIVAGILVIVSHALQSATNIWRQSALVVTGALVPLVLNVLNVLSITPPGSSTALNWTPVSLSLSTILFGVAIFRYRMFDLTPIASRVVLEQMGDGVLVLDDAERIVDLNSSAETLVGDRDAVIGSDVSSHLPQYKLLQQGNQTHVSSVGDDEERLFQLTRSPLSMDGLSYGWVVLANDVTDLERQRRELAKQNERLDAFSRIVAHDLRNPLVVIGGYTDLAEETGETKHFDTIRKHVSHVSTFLEDLLLLSQQGETVEDLRPVPLAAIVEDVRRGIADRSLHVETQTDVVVMADWDRLRQVLDNLFRNARDHSDGDVTVYVYELHDGFAVEDTGPGIAADAREHVFDIGFSTREDGSGFGLPIIRDIVEAHGWSIAVTEGAAGGGRFEITGVEFVTSD